MRLSYQTDCVISRRALDSLGQSQLCTQGPQGARTRASRRRWLRGQMVVHTGQQGSIANRLNLLGLTGKGCTRQVLAGDAPRRLVRGTPLVTVTLGFAKAAQG